jgi:anti-sigma factor RsiW
MSHVTEILAEFVFEELSAPEMAEARQHIAACDECKNRVEQFQHTLVLLKAAPEVDPPRNIVFEFDKRPARRFWQWMPAAVAVAALLLITVALAGRVHVQWHDSQLTIAFGATIAPAQTDQGAGLAAEIENMKASLVYLQRQQEAAERYTTVLATKIEPIAGAQRSPTGD